MRMMTFTAEPSPERGGELRKVRQAAEVPVTVMAAATGYTEKQIRNWENGTSPFRRAIVLAYAVICGVDPDELVMRVADRAGCLYVDNQAELPLVAA